MCEIDLKIAFLWRLAVNKYFNMKFVDTVHFIVK